MLPGIAAQAGGDQQAVLMRTKGLGEITAERMRAVVRLTDERSAAAPVTGALGGSIGESGLRPGPAADPAHPAQVPDQGWRPDEHQDRAIDQSVRPVVAGVLDRSLACGLPLGVRGHVPCSSRRRDDS